MHGLALAFNCVHYGATLIGKSITLGYREYTVVLLHGGQQVYVDADANSD